MWLALRSTKVRSNIILLAVFVLCGFRAQAGVPANKRTILTSGDAVHQVRYQLGQSTLLFFGFKPETVLCGNKNYFNIEKFKDGITVQPLSNFSTNLTVIDGGRRFLFYLVPSGSNAPDGFVDVKWIAPQEVQALPSSTGSSMVVKDLKQSAKLAGDVELRLLQAKSVRDSGRTILEFTIKNLRKQKVVLADVELVIFSAKLPSPGQVTVWEKEEVRPGETVTGRSIFNAKNAKEVNLVIGYKQKTTKLIVSKGVLFAN